MVISWISSNIYIIIFITAFYQTEVYIMTMLEWWQKAKGIIQSIYDSVTCGDRLCHKAL
jgi:hypothetical protein